MQDINPIRKTLPVKENTENEDVDIRRSVGINQTDTETSEATTQTEKVPLKPREEFAFSSLYSPESRKNIRTQVTPPVPKLRTRKDKNGILTFFVGSVLFLAFVLYTFVFSSVKVNITPVRTNIPVEQTITIPAIDLQIGNDVLVVTASSSDSRDVPRRGVSNVETKASGVITILNNNNTSPQKLITNTRFESASGKIYRIAESITVPGMKGSTPGTIDATVFADSTGADYNLESGALTIPGFKGSSIYTKFSAKVKTPISGGSSGTQSAVADEDLAAVHTAILAELNKKIESEIQTKKPSADFIYLPDATSFTTTNNKKDLLTDQKIKYTETIVARAVFIKKDYLAKKILENTSHTAEENLLLEDTKDLVFGVPTKEATTSNKDDIIFTVTGSPNFISDLDQATIASRLTGVSKATFVERMKEFAGIDSAEPHFSPFWISHFPNDVKRIHILISKN